MHKWFWRKNRTIHWWILTRFTGKEQGVEYREGVRGNNSSHLEATARVKFKNLTDLEKDIIHFLVKEPEFRLYDSFYRQHKLERPGKKCAFNV